MVNIGSQGEALASRERAAEAALQIVPTSASAHRGRSVAIILEVMVAIVFGKLVNKNFGKRL